MAVPKLPNSVLKRWTNFFPKGGKEYAVVELSGNGTAGDSGWTASIDTSKCGSVLASGVFCSTPSGDPIFNIVDASLPANFNGTTCCVVSGDGESTPTFSNMEPYPGRPSPPADPWSVIEPSGAFDTSEGSTNYICFFCINQIKYYHISSTTTAYVRLNPSFSETIYGGYANSTFTGARSGPGAAVKVYKILGLTHPGYWEYHLGQPEPVWMPPIPVKPLLTYYYIDPASEEFNSTTGAINYVTIFSMGDITGYSINSTIAFALSLIDAGQYADWIYFAAMEMVRKPKKGESPKDPEFTITMSPKWQAASLQLYTKEYFNVSLADAAGPIKVKKAPTGYPAEWGNNAMAIFSANWDIEIDTSVNPLSGLRVIYKSVQPFKSNKYTFKALVPQVTASNPYEVSFCRVFRTKKAPGGLLYRRITGWKNLTSNPPTLTTLGTKANPVDYPYIWGTWKP